MTRELRLALEPDEDLAPPWECCEGAPPILSVLRDYKLGEDNRYRLDNNMDELLATARRKYGELAIVRDVYAYIHSGIRLQLDSPDGLPDVRWDVSFAGIMVYPRELLLDNLGGTNLTKAKLAKARTDMESTLEVINGWLSGGWRWEILDGDGDFVEGCGGYYLEKDAQQDGDEALERLKKENQ